MSGWRNNGGWNKTHGTVEETARIDSYEAAAVENCGTLFAYSGGRSMTFGCSHYYGPGPNREVVKVWQPKDGWCQTIELSRKRNGCGGSQAFFLCPACTRRVRYLYQVGAAFLCRKCAQLNYRSQQETRSDSMFYYRKGVDFVEKRLDTWPRVRPDGFSFYRWAPPRPRYMHESTYRKYLRRFSRYQHHHQERQLEDMVKLLKLCK